MFELVSRVEEYSELMNHSLNSCVDVTWATSTFYSYFVLHVPQTMEYPIDTFNNIHCGFPERETYRPTPYHTKFVIMFIMMSAILFAITLIKYICFNVYKLLIKVLMLPLEPVIGSVKVTVCDRMGQLLIQEVYQMMMTQMS